MSDQQTAPVPPQFTSPKDAKSQAKAEKAYRKATRPWFKKKRFILPLALVLLVAIFAATSGGDDAGTASSTSQSGANNGAQAAKDPVVGDKVRDGKFEFVVTKVERPGKTLPTAFGTEEKAQGEFIIVRVDVTNIGNEAQTLDTTGQVLFNDKGQEFKPSSAIFSIKDSDKFFLEQINPGNKVTGAPLLFDVAPGTKITSIELHDSMFSDGVKVKLS